MSDADVSAVSTLDLERYLGRWYEIGRLPMRHQDADSRDVTAEYSLDDDGAVRVDNRCIDGDGEPAQAVGRAELVDGEPGQLTVSFLPKYLRWIPFTDGDYWVLRVDADYTTALVGTPDRKFLWLLARQPRLAAEVKDDFLATARRQGFDLAGWIDTPQSGERVTDDQLAAD